MIAKVVPASLREARFGGHGKVEKDYAQTKNLAAAAAAFRAATQHPFWFDSAGAVIMVRHKSERARADRLGQKLETKTLETRPLETKRRGG
jgi:hypothetical protein